MTKTTVVAGIASFVILAGATAIVGELTKSPLKDIPEAKKSDLITETKYQGVYGVGLIIEDGKALKKLAPLFKEERLQRQGKYSIEEYDAVTFDGKEAWVFFVMTEAAYMSLPSNLPIPYRGGIIVDSIGKEAEQSIIRTMHENGVKSYEIITI